MAKRTEIKEFDTKEEAKVYMIELNNLDTNKIFCVTKTMDDKKYQVVDLEMAKMCNLDYEWSMS